MTLFLIDGNSYAYRAFYGIKGLTNSLGQPTNAVFGFTNMLLKIIKVEKPDYMAIVFDFPAPTFRHKEFKDYKSGRQPMPEDLISQIVLIKEIINALNIRTFEKEGFEADDVLATIARKAEISGIKTKIMTSDKDILQLINDNINVVSPYKEYLVYDRMRVKEKFNVYPENMIDFLALTGDQADNIPGIPGIGEKTAVLLLSKFKNLEGIYEHISLIENEKLKNSLETNKDKVILAKRLIKLVNDVPLDIDSTEELFKSLKLTSPELDRLKNLFVKLDFKSLLSEIPIDVSLDSVSTVLEMQKSEKINNEQQLKEKIKEIKKHSKLVVYATDADLIVYIKQNEVISIPLQPDFISLLREIFENDKIEKYGVNLKNVILKLSEYNIKLKNIKFDFEIASYVLSRKFKSEQMQNTIDSIVELSSKAIDELKEKEMLRLFEEIEMPLVEVLANMEENGIKLDMEFLKAYSNLLESNLKKLTDEIYNLAGEKFNINSSQQLSKILFEKLKLPGVKKTKTGYSTSGDVLETLAGRFELPSKIIDYRTLYKLKSTYVDTLPELISHKTGKIHTSFNQTVTSTGRLSSSSPNLQNIPIKTDVGRLLRKAFIPVSPENIFLSVDYSQIEIRILAHVSGDKSLIEAFKKNEDVHTATAVEIFGVRKEEVSSSIRRIAKTVNFGIIYGMSPFGLSKELKISRIEAKNYIDNYFKKYDGVKNYIEETIRKTQEIGYVTTIFGRRRYIPDINSKNRVIREFAERSAVNMPIQGSAADIIKLAMIKINEIIKKLNIKMLVQVHDELLFEVSMDKLDDARETIKETMENVVQLNVPLKVEIKSGKNWYEAH